jgi:hypothetical protein
VATSFSVAKEGLEELVIPLDDETIVVAKEKLGPTPILDNMEEGLLFISSNPSAS